MARYDDGLVIVVPWVRGREGRGSYDSGGILDGEGRIAAADARVRLLVESCWCSTGWRGGENEDEKLKALHSEWRGYFLETSLLGRALMRLYRAICANKGNDMLLC